jgi:hypothetical protein
MIRAVIFLLSAAASSIVLSCRYGCWLQQVVAGSKLGRISAPAVDCGSATSTCQEASGKVCLIKRDKTMTFCQMVQNCVLGGGVAAAIWNEEMQQPCKPLLGAELQGECDMLPIVGLVGGSVAKKLNTLS